MLWCLQRSSCDRWNMVLRLRRPGGALLSRWASSDDWSSFCSVAERLCASASFSADGKAESVFKNQAFDCSFRAKLISCYCLFKKWCASFFDEWFWWVNDAAALLLPDPGQAWTIGLRSHVNAAVKGTIIWVWDRLMQRESRKKAQAYISLTSAAPLPTVFSSIIQIQNDRWKPSLV